MKHQPKKHFDISKPPRHGPDPTSKPVIIGHRPMMPDPMLREEREKAAKPIKVVADGESPEPVTTEQLAKPAPEPVAELKPAAMPEHAPGAIFPPTEVAHSSSVTANPPDAPAATTLPPPQPLAKEPAAPTPSEPLTNQQLHIPAGRPVIHHKPRIWVWVLMALIILAWAYAAIDVLSGIKLPYEFFQNSPQ